jgi:hypothetical protein
MTGMTNEQIIDMIKAINKQVAEQERLALECRRNGCPPGRHQQHVLTAAGLRRALRIISTHYMAANADEPQQMTDAQRLGAIMQAGA